MRIGFFTILLCISATVFCTNFSRCSQEDLSLFPEKSKKNPFYLGIEAGFTFYQGDLKNNNLHIPLYRRYGLQICAEREIFRGTRLCINAFSGNLYGDELRNNRNLNFRTFLLIPQIGLSYNLFSLSSDKLSERLALYAFAGAEGIFFSVSGDLKTRNGEKYYYWSNGSLMNQPENYYNLTTAVPLERDYIYETNYQNLDIDNVGKYPQFALGLPVGLSAEVKISEFGFRLGARYHFTMTDFLDNITAQSIGSRAGNARNDKFLFVYAGLFYHLPEANSKHPYRSSCGYKKSKPPSRKKINRIN